LFRGEFNFDDKYVEKSVQLLKGSSFRNDLLQNPYFKPTTNTEIIDELKLLRNASEVDCECFICQDKKWQIIKIWKELQQPRSYKPLCLLIFLFTLQQLSGPHAVVSYAVNIFSGIIVDKRAASFTAISVGAIKILGSVIAIVFLKKKLSKRLQVCINNNMEKKQEEQYHHLKILQTLTSKSRNYSKFYFPDDLFSRWNVHRNGYLCYL
jgi:hypothetical protein